MVLRARGPDFPFAPGSCERSRPQLLSSDRRSHRRKTRKMSRCSCSGSPAWTLPRPGSRSPSGCPGTREGLESARARGRVGGRKPKLAARQAEVARGMYEEKGDDGKRKYTVAEIAETFGVSRKTVYRHLEPAGG